MEDRKRLVQREESVRLSPHVYLISILNLTGVCGTDTHKRRAAGVCVFVWVCVLYTVCTHCRPAGSGYLSAVVFGVVAFSLRG